MFLYPLLASILGAAEINLNKKFLSKFKTKAQEYVASDFFVVVVTLTLLLPLFYQFPYLTRSQWLYGLAAVLAGLVGNFFYLKALNSDTVVTLEPFRIFSPFLSVIIALLFFQEEVNSMTIILLLVATAALFISQEPRSFLQKKKALVSIISAIALFSLEPFFLKQVLASLNPFMTYYLRGLAIFVLLYLLFRPKMIIFEKKKTRTIASISTMSTAKKILIYFGYAQLGVLNTVLIVLLRHPLEYLFAWWWLKEEITLRNILSSVIIIACVVTYLIV